MRDRRDTAWVKDAQQAFADGYHARLAEPHPCIKDKTGKDTQRREPKWFFGTETAEARCPQGVEEKRSPNGMILVPAQAWPSHKRERWIAGWSHCDSLCAERGLTYAKANDPLRVRKAKPVIVAEEQEMFPEAIISKERARDFWKRYRGERKSFSTADEQ
jgi:hypothetical protein